MTDTIDTEIAAQPALPSLELPEFEGLLPVGVVTKLTGAGERITRAIHHGERVILLVEAELVDIAHPKTKDGIKRHQKLSVADLYEVEGAEGKRLLTHMREAYRMADDQRHGRLPLADGVGTVRVPAGFTDDHGNLLDEEALAEIRGESLTSAMADPGLDPVVVVFDDRSSQYWPDDFDPGTPKPEPGSFVVDRQVREWLDPDSEDVLAEWTDEQEDARLAELEEAARAREAVEDRAAFEELEAARGRVVGEPWPGYEQSTAKEVVEHVRSMDDRDEVFAVAGWEEAHGGRKTIVEACGRRAAELLEGGE